MNCLTLITGDMLIINGEPYEITRIEGGVIVAVPFVGSPIIIEVKDKSQ